MVYKLQELCLVNCNYIYTISLLAAAIIYYLTLLALVQFCIRMESTEEMDVQDTSISTQSQCITNQVTQQDTIGIKFPIWKMRGLDWSL